jgi:aminoglycoside/choline kinase family phosphotransferase
MKAILDDISQLFSNFTKQPILGLHKIPQSGSNRMYFRILTEKESFIATFNNHIQENRTFIYFSRHFRSGGNPVPEIFTVNADYTIYIQEDFGDQSLLSRLEGQGYSPEVYQLFKKSLHALAKLQVTGDLGLDYGQCITSKEFGKQAILSDLLYFKYYFLDTLEIPYDKEKLIDDFESLSSELTHTGHKFFMFRDFQSRNILVRDQDLHFIDFQGGMKGALQYDVASLLWQAKADLPEDWKRSLLIDYMDGAEKILNAPLDRPLFVKQYQGYVLLRLLQVLGAYGFRGLFERKAHFLISIPMGLRNLKNFLHHQKLDLRLPEFERLLNLITEPGIIGRFEPMRADARTALVVHINSFSYNRGMPPDPFGNGGGFVFDCRAILNPGRQEQFRNQTGRDKEVKDFLEQQTQMPAFLNSVYSLVDISVQDYMQREFGHLMVNFGCTGGQHRSVYAAEALARHLRNKFNAKIDLHHLEQELKS